MSLTVSYHGPSTTRHARQSVLGRPCAGLQSLHQQLIVATN